MAGRSVASTSTSASIASARCSNGAPANEIINVSVYQALMTVSRLKLGRTKAPDLDPVTPVADDIVDETLKHCSPVLAAMIELQRATGMRPAEVCNLTPGMIDRSVTFGLRL